MMKLYSMLLLSATLATAQYAVAQNQSRLISNAALQNTGTSFVLTDSFTYTYSNGRGSDMKTGDYKYDTSVYYNTLGPSERYIQGFNTANQLVEKVVQQFNATAFEKYLSYHYYYNTHPAYDSVVTEKWNPFNKIWQRYSRIRYSYTAGGKLSRVDEDSWDITGYSPARRVLYVYDAANNLRSTTEEFWDGSVWTGNERHFYLSDASNRIISDSLELWSQPATQWQLEFKTTYSYDAGGHIATLKEEDWDPVTSDWLSQFIHYYQYNGAGYALLDSLTVWNDDSAKYIKSRLYINTYNAANSLTSNVEKFVQADTFVNFRKKEWSYNSFEQPLVYTAYQWNDGSKNWDYLLGSGALKRYHYQLYDPVNVAEVPGHAQGSIYPNPASTYVRVMLPPTQAPTATIAAYDMQGRLAKQWVVPVQGQYSMPLSVSDMPEGHYQLHMQLADKEMTFPLLISR